jgi:hypothetical protein
MAAIFIHAIITAIRTCTNYHVENKTGTVTSAQADQQRCPVPMVICWMILWFLIMNESMKTTTSDTHISSDNISKIKSILINKCQPGNADCEDGRLGDVWT